MIDHDDDDHDDDLLVSGEYIYICENNHYIPHGLVVRIPFILNGIPGFNSRCGNCKP